MAKENPSEAKRKSVKINPLESWFELIKEFDQVGLMLQEIPNKKIMEKKKHFATFLLHETKIPLIKQIPKKLEQLSKLGLIPADFEERRKQFFLTNKTKKIITSSNKAR